MDDLDVIRLAVIDNIAKGRIARAKVEVKEIFGGGGGGAGSGLPEPSSGLSFVPGERFYRRNIRPVRRVGTLVRTISCVSDH
jgi:hypothetical protein